MFSDPSLPMLSLSCLLCQEVTTWTAARLRTGDCQGSMVILQKAVPDIVSRVLPMLGGQEDNEQVKEDVKKIKGRLLGIVEIYRTKLTGKKTEGEAKFYSLVRLHLDAILDSIKTEILKVLLEKIAFECRKLLYAYCLVC